MRLAFEPISEIDQVRSYLAIAELKALCLGSFAISDFDWEDAALAQSYVDSLSDPVERADLTAEPMEAVARSQEQFISEFREQLIERVERLGEAYPFHFDPSGDIFLKPKAAEEINSAGYSYCWLIIFKALRDRHHLTNVDREERYEFDKLFSKVFEATCCLALAGRESSPVWYFGPARGTTKLLAKLGSVAAYLPGSAIKAKEHLQAHQLSRNDLGVDAVSIKSFGGLLQGDSYILILGATIQARESLIQKIVGPANRISFRDFFLRPPGMPIYSALAVPHDSDEIISHRCSENDCLYISFEDLISHLGNSVGVVIPDGNLDDARSIIEDISRRALPTLEVLP
jgi:hypothetical protein